MMTFLDYYPSAKPVSMALFPLRQMINDVDCVLLHDGQSHWVTGTTLLAPPKLASHRPAQPGSCTQMMRTQRAYESGLLLVILWYRKRSEVWLTGVDSIREDKHTLSAPTDSIYLTLCVCFPSSLVAQWCGQQWCHEVTGGSFFSSLYRWTVDLPRSASGLCFDHQPWVRR